MNRGTSIGTIIDISNPLTKDTTAVSLFVFLVIIGRVVSIAVAPPKAIVSKNPMYFAVTGINIIAKNRKAYKPKNGNSQKDFFNVHYLLIN